ncbi:MAG TPA: hypothetical protein VNT75_13495 [Symbiobacteriaceae bacterium]|nr:hypothetical protein [Symbiobacteriaceae bacterium]
MAKSAKKPATQSGTTVSTAVPTSVNGQITDVAATPTKKKKS